MKPPKILFKAAVFRSKDSNTYHPPPPPQATRGFDVLDLAPDDHYSRDCELIPSSLLRGTC